MSKRSDEPRWTLEELGAEVAAALSVGYEGPRSGQVKAVPDARAIRYYSTLGLIDRPAAMRGRTALYAEKHLLQLVAIKRLQASGRSLAEVQAALVGLGAEELRGIAALPQAPRGDALEEGRGQRPARGRFWGTLPSDTLPAAPAARQQPDTAPAAELAALRLEGALLVLAPARPLTEEDAAALRAAAAPLLEELERRGLCTRAG